MSDWLCYPNTLTINGTITLADGTVLNVGPGLEEDLVYYNNSPYAIDGADETLQAIRKNLKSFLGEWFLDTNLGTPWKQSVLVQNPTVADAQIKNAIAGSVGVEQILSFNYNFNAQTGQITVSFTVQSQGAPLPGVVEVFV